ncbi:MAG TPA: hypothetical protein VHI52_06800 [Verrucomicrobiae bacterium]|nr:hypothetical protein [Verrucomicrobiae bacterium]
MSNSPEARLSMKKRIFPRAVYGLAGMVGLVLVSVLAGPRPAAAQVFTIDTNQSSITISGTVLGNTFTNQGPGSLTARIGGSLQAVTTGSTITFTGQSVIQAFNSGSWQPNADGTTGSQPANYGALAVTLLGTGVAALRDVLLDVTSPAISLSNGQFDSSSLTFLFPSNATTAFAYNISGSFVSTHGAEPMTGYATNKVTKLGSLTSAGGAETITIPVNATFLLSLVSANDTSITLQGQLVAVSAAEPPLTIQSIGVQNNTVTVQWQGSPSQQIHIETSFDLRNWLTNAGSITSSNGVNTWTAPAVGPQQFIRLGK